MTSTKELKAAITAREASLKGGNPSAFPEKEILVITFTNQEEKLRTSFEKGTSLLEALKHIVHILENKQNYVERHL